MRGGATLRNLAVVRRCCGPVPWNATWLCLRPPVVHGGGNAVSRPTAQLGTGGHSGEMRTAGLAVMELTGGAVRQYPVMNKVSFNSNVKFQYR